MKMMSLKNKDTYELVLNADDLRVIMSCLREVLVEIGSAEFPSRIGAKSEDVNKLANELFDLMDENGIDL